jgi:hypothetical protein
VRWVAATALGLAVASLLVFQRPIRLEYHKSRLQALKAKRDRCMSAKLSKPEKLWLQVTGRPTSTTSLANGIQKHEDALVRLGFLRRKNFEMQPENDVESKDLLAALRGECPWYHAEIIDRTNLVMVTACPRMFEHWRKRAHQSGWKEFPATHL